MEAYWSDASTNQGMPRTIPTIRSWERDGLGAEPLKEIKFTSTLSSDF